MLLQKWQQALCCGCGIRTDDHVQGGESSGRQASRYSSKVVWETAWESSRGQCQCLRGVRASCVEMRVLKGFAERRELAGQLHYLV